MFNRKYRIVDEVDSKKDMCWIEVQSRTILDKLLMLGWQNETYIQYACPTSKIDYIKKTREEAIAEAEAWIDNVKNGQRKVSKTVIKVI